MGTHKKKKPVNRAVIDPPFEHLSTERKEEVITQEALRGYSIKAISERLGCSTRLVYATIQKEDVKKKLDDAKAVRDAMFQQKIEAHNERAIDNWIEMYQLADTILKKELDDIANGEMVWVEESVEFQPTSAQIVQVMNRLAIEKKPDTKENVLEMYRKMCPVTKITCVRKKPNGKDMAALWTAITKHFFYYQKKSGGENAP